MCQKSPFVVNLVLDDQAIETHYSWHNLRRTLRLAWELAKGVGSAYVGIHYKGERIAELETNQRGELTEASIFAERRIDNLPYPWLRVTQLNVHSRIFEERERDLQRIKA